jgi:hypothetical protein
MIELDGLIQYRGEDGRIHTMSPVRTVSGKFRAVRHSDLPLVTYSTCHPRLSDGAVRVEKQIEDECAICAVPGSGKPRYTGAFTETLVEVLIPTGCQGLICAGNMPE